MKQKIFFTILLLIFHNKIFSQVLAKDTFNIHFSVLNFKTESKYFKIPLLKIKPGMKEELQKKLLHCSDKQIQSSGLYEFTASKNSDNYFIGIGMTSYKKGMDTIKWTGVFFIDKIPFFCRTSYYNEAMYENYQSGDSITIFYDKIIEEDTITEIILSSFLEEVEHKSGFFKLKDQNIKYYMDVCYNHKKYKKGRRKR